MQTFQRLSSRYRTLIAFLCKRYRPLSSGLWATVLLASSCEQWYPSKTDIIRFLFAMQAVLQPSSSLPQGTPTIRGYDFNNGLDLSGIMDSMITTGCQASALGQACNEVNRMVSTYS